jgi:hypothetical protein
LSYLPFTVSAGRASVPHVNVHCPPRAGRKALRQVAKHIQRGRRVGCACGSSSINGERSRGEHTARQSEAPALPAGQVAAALGSRVAVRLQAPRMLRVPAAQYRFTVDRERPKCAAVVEILASPSLRHLATSIGSISKGRPMLALPLGVLPVRSRCSRAVSPPASESARRSACAPCQPPGPAPPRSVRRRPQQ